MRIDHVIQKYPSHGGDIVLSENLFHLQANGSLWATALYEGGVALASKYAAIGHTHDERYYTENEVNSLLAGKAAASHTHADLQASINALNTNKVSALIDLINANGFKISAKKFFNLWAENGYISFSPGHLGLNNVIFAIAMDNNVPGGIVFSGFYAIENACYISAHKKDGTLHAGNIDCIILIGFGY